MSETCQLGSETMAEFFLYYHCGWEVGTERDLETRHICVLIDTCRRRHPVRPVRVAGMARAAAAPSPMQLGHGPGASPLGT